MLVVLTHALDTGARLLVGHWRAHNARLLVAGDLCAPGWRFEPASSDHGFATIDGVRVPAGAIQGVVTRIPHIRGLDLPQIVEGDRAYVSSELNAFLTAWLDALPCPVLNRPSAGSLMGPPFSHERWLILAARAGLALASRRYQAPEVHRTPAMAIVTVVGERWFGEVAPDVGMQALRLARLARVDLLTVRFTSATSGAAFSSADLLTDTTPEIADALLARLLGART